MSSPSQNLKKRNRQPPILTRHIIRPRPTPNISLSLPHLPLHPLRRRLIRPRHPIPHRARQHPNPILPPHNRFLRRMRQDILLESPHPVAAVR